jgi:GntR family transcriptional regulator of vanillate catabolism
MVRTLKQPASPRDTADESAGTAIYQRLRDLIVSGRLPPNVRVAEGPLADALGVSRMPVREAMQRLRHERLLVPVGGGTGARVRLAVAPLSREQMDELYGLAAALEGMAGRSLVTRSPAERSKLAQSLEATERAFHAEARHRSPDLDRLFTLHREFHRTLVHAAAGPETLALLAVFAAPLDRYEWFYAPLIGPDFSATRKEHAAIIAAARNGTANEIEKAIRVNWMNAAARLRPVIDRSVDALHTLGAGQASLYSSLLWR